MQRRYEYTNGTTFRTNLPSGIGDDPAGWLCFADSTDPIEDSDTLRTLEVLPDLFLSLLHHFQSGCALK